MFRESVQDIGMRLCFCGYGENALLSFLFSAVVSRCGTFVPIDVLDHHRTCWPDVFARCFRAIESHLESTRQLSLLTPSSECLAFQVTEAVLESE